MNAQRDWGYAKDYVRGRSAQTGKVLVEVDPQYYRPVEVDQLLGDSSKARDVLGWSTKYTLQAMIEEMVQSYLRIAKNKQ